MVKRNRQGKVSLTRDLPQDHYHLTGLEGNCLLCLQWVLIWRQRRV